MTDERGHPPVKEGYVRIYDDHTGRFYTDFTNAEMDEMANDVFVKILNEEIRKEIDNEVVDFLIMTGLT